MGTKTHKSAHSHVQVLHYVSFSFKVINGEIVDCKICKLLSQRLRKIGRNRHCSNDIITIFENVNLFSGFPRGGSKLVLFSVHTSARQREATSTFDSLITIRQSLLGVRQALIIFGILSTF